jgi:NADH-quinone oxidoreductase subunit L
VAHTVTTGGVAIACIASYVIFKDVMAGNTYNGPVYQWLTSGDYRFEVGFLIDQLTVTMMLVVTFVSLMVHIYTIGYMQDDPGYNRFFSYIALFTFSMLMLVMSNNFMQLFFRLGGRRPGFLSADRFLVYPADGDLRQPESVPGQPCR